MLTSKRNGGIFENDWLIAIKKYCSSLLICFPTIIIVNSFKSTFLLGIKHFLSNLYFRISSGSQQKAIGTIMKGISFLRNIREVALYMANIEASELCFA